MSYSFSVEERFLKYVQIDTTADPNSESFPSSMKQKDLAKVLVEELKDLGIADAEMDEWGYVFGTVPSNSENKNLPTICFCSHMDTAPDCSGTNVKPIVHRNYDGTPIVLPDDVTQIITTEKHSYLKSKIGDDLEPIKNLYFKITFESINIVTGPSLISAIFISAPNSPESTFPLNCDFILLRKYS